MFDEYEDVNQDCLDDFQEEEYLEGLYGEPYEETNQWKYCGVENGI
jgi:hypothetical protein